MEKQKKWLDRHSDHRTRPLENLFVITMGIFYFTLLLFVVFLFEDGLDASEILFGIFSFIFSVLFAFSMSHYGGRMMHFLFPRIVQDGHIGLVKFRDVYTGEFIEPGPVMLPLFGYDFDEVDCRQFIVESGESDVRSLDGFLVRANVSAWLRINNALAHKNQKNVDALLSKLLSSTISSVAAKNNALEIIGDRDRACAIAKEEIEDMISQYGLVADKVAVNILSVPAELTGLVQILSILEKRYPDSSTSELTDILMMHSGKIQTSRSESKNTTRIETPSIDVILAAAAKRFG